MALLIPPTHACSLCSGIPLGQVTSLRRVGCVLAIVGKVPEPGRKAGGTGRGRRGALQGAGAGPTSDAPGKNRPGGGAGRLVLDTGLRAP